MTYISFEWVLLMSAVTLVFWVIPGDFRFYFLIFATFAFLVIKDFQSVLVLICLTGITYFSTRNLVLTGRQVALAIFLSTSVLIGYKILSAASGDDLLSDTLIPLGLSYYVLRCIHYILERYKGSLDVRPLRNLVTYLFFLPTIFIGPIHRFEGFEHDMRRHRWNSALFSEGLERILYGYVKIVFLGNFLISQVFSNWAADVTEGGTVLATYFLMVQLGLNLYFQFSGFSDIAIGFARLLGFRVMENFNWPFFKKNISEFWQSWHISLTSWCREYVYRSVISLTRSPALGALATLITIALWHEVSLRYLVWGCYHGLGIIVWQKFQKLHSRFPTVKTPFMRQALDLLSILLTVHFVWFGFLLVRGLSIKESVL